MPTVMPVSDLQRNFKAVADACAQSGEPVYLTRNGYPALVIMDAKAYEEEKALKDLIFEREMRIHDALERGHDQAQEGTATPLEAARAMRATQ